MAEAMRIEHDRIEGDVELLDADLELHGVAAGNITVGTGRTLLLYGVCNGSIAVQEGGTALLQGTVNGNVTNFGGRVEIFDTVHGNLYDLAGETTIHEGAALKGERKTRTEE